MSLLQALNLPPPPKRRASPAADGGKLSQAAAAWIDTHRQARQRIDALRQSVKARCADAPPPFVRQVDQGLARLDQVLATVDERLAQALSKAAANPAARDAELKTAKSILGQYESYLKGETLIAHIDRNPFDVKTDLQALFAAGLAQAAEAIG